MGRGAFTAIVLLVAALVATGCSDAKTNDVPTLGFMTWRDQTGLDAQLIARCNQQAQGRWRVEHVTMGPTTDAAREQLMRRLAAGDASIDMINLDVIWTAEFSDAGWIIDITERVKPIKDQYIQAAIDSVHYKDRYWAVPVGMNSALLYYRTDLVKTPPQTWEELRDIAKLAQQKEPGIAGFVFQGAPVEGGTVDALEFIYGAGAEILSPDGKQAVLSEGEGALRAFTWLNDVMKEKVAPKTVTTYVEEDTRLAFQNGKAVFMRNWPYAFTLMNQDKASKVRGKFDVVALPGFAGHDSASVIGGQNYGITASSKHPEEAWEAISCLSSVDSQREKAIKKGELPVLDSLYHDDKVKAEFPFIAESYRALQTARNRPITPYYNDLTLVIAKAYNDVLNGNETPEAAIKRIDRGVQKALEGEAEI